MRRWRNYTFLNRCRAQRPYSGIRSFQRCQGSKPFQAFNNEVYHFPAKLDEEVAKLQLHSPSAVLNVTTQE